MKTLSMRFFATPVFFTVLFAVTSVSGDESIAKPSIATWKAGLAKIVITPERQMFASGYASRDHASQGKIHDLFARVCVLEDWKGYRACFISLDLIGIPKPMATRLAAYAKTKHRLNRSQLMIACSHTHSGPALDDKLSHMLRMNDDDWKEVKRYQKTLDRKVEQAIDNAFADLQPALLFSGLGKTTFAVNRRPPTGKGPVDHDVPVLKIVSQDGKRVRGIIFGYACHNTTLSFFKWCGDYAGFAALYLEDRFPGTTALFFSGCGADQNPLPRRKIELAEKYGRMLGTAVEKTLSQPMAAVQQTLRTAYREIELFFDHVPSKLEIEKTLETGNRYEKIRARLQLAEIGQHGKLKKSYHYPIQVWQLGKSITWIALGGEVVVDYSLRLKKELGRKTTWVTGYANDVMAYIPSERVLQEGGYEGATAMVYYQLPSRWKPGLEQRIVDTVKDLVTKCEKPISPR